jgi:hypothetical protein
LTPLAKRSRLQQIRSSPGSRGNQLRFATNDGIVVRIDSDGLADPNRMAKL